MMRKMIALMLLAAIALLTVLPVAAQGGRGAVVQGSPPGLEGIYRRNPLNCLSQLCLQAAELLFPSLLAVDPATGTFIPAPEDSTALALSWDVSPDGRTYTFHLRDDLTWSDGVPVTAYDVFYTFLVLDSNAIGNAVYTIWGMTGAVPPDAATIVFLLEEDLSDCAALVQFGFPIIPAHYFEPDFAETADAAFDEDGDLVAQFEQWQEDRADLSFAAVSNDTFQNVPTAGLFEPAPAQTNGALRLTRDGGAQSMVYQDVPDANTQVDQFLSGELNLIVNPPYNRRQDIAAAPDVQIAEYPGGVWYFISFNLADPGNPQDAFDDQGRPLDQGVHPIFGDVRVRRAAQLAIDVNALIESTVYGSGTVMPANQLPTSWAFNADLAPVGYDPAAAARLLDEAGWRDRGDNGILDCVECLYAPEGSALSFTLLIDDQVSNGLAVLIEQQLREVGFGVSPWMVDPGTLRSEVFGQRYDMYLGAYYESYPVEPDLRTLFSTEDDRVGMGWNVGSYSNPTVDDLMVRARDIPGCEVEARAEIYREVQAILQEDQPYVWLFAPNEFIAARGSIQGFDPRPRAPLWNLRDWVIVP